MTANDSHGHQIDEVTFDDFVNICDALDVSLRNVVQSCEASVNDNCFDVHEACETADINRDFVETNASWPSLRKRIRELHPVGNCVSCAVWHASTWAEIALAVTNDFLNRISCSVHGNLSWDFDHVGFSQLFVDAIAKNEDISDEKIAIEIKDGWSDAKSVIQSFTFDELEQLRVRVENEVSRLDASRFYQKKQRTGQSQLEFSDCDFIAKH